ncbi:MAG: peptidase M15 [Flavobacterium sp.]|nr:MAG: peptidase M15 [Flavobacterium sp.]
MQTKNRLFLLLVFFGIVLASAQSQSLNDSTFVNLRDYSSDFVRDMKYATDDNFLKATVYDCAECYLRLKTVKALIAANDEFQRAGFRIKLFDCYRPLRIQRKMWLLVKDPKYVADPAKGSVHNRGGAVDITLVDLSGTEVEMGTEFDFFGPEAAHSFRKLPKKILHNRKFLKAVMVRHGFKSFESEWWHYNLKDALNDKVSDFKWNCD